MRAPRALPSPCRGPVGPLTLPAPHSPPQERDAFPYSQMLKWARRQLGCRQPTAKVHFLTTDVAEIISVSPQPGGTGPFPGTKAS